MMRVLAESFDITLACPHDEPTAPEQLEHVNGICEAVRTEPTGITRWASAGLSALQGRSLTEGLFHSKTLQQQILDLHHKRPFDAVLVFCSSMFPYVDRREFNDTPVVVDLVDVDSEKWHQMSLENRIPKNLIYRMEATRVRALEHRIADRAAAIILVSDSEAELFRSKVQTQTPVLGVSNGVDTDYFHSSSFVPNESSVETTELQSTRLVFTGVLDYPPNVEGMVWFCNSILPKLRERIAIQLDIVGRRPNQTVKDLGKLDEVNLIGEVPDVRPYLHGADIAISPLKLARGIQNKVLEAMACGLPVVTTTQSAEGIDAIDGEEIVIADRVDDWIEAVCKLANDPVKSRSLGRNARALVLGRYAWSSRLRTITEVVADTICK